MVKLPIWFTNHHGHQLEEKYLKAFPQLNKYKRDKEEALKQAVIEASIADSLA